MVDGGRHEVNARPDPHASLIGVSAHPHLRVLATSERVGTCVYVGIESKDKTAAHHVALSPSS